MAAEDFCSNLGEFKTVILVFKVKFCVLFSYKLCLVYCMLLVRMCLALYIVCMLAWYGCFSLSISHGKICINSKYNGIQKSTNHALTPSRIRTLEMQS